METVTKKRRNWNGTSKNRAGKKPSSQDKAQELRARIDDSLDTLAKAVDEVRASETFRKYLEIQARFHRYSWHNSLLIMSQRPDATQVAGFKAWEKLSRHVNKGEKGIMIFAPRSFHKEVERSNGETDTIDGIYFRPVYVFDVSQTDGQELPTVDVPTIQARADSLLSDLCNVSTHRGISVDFRKIDSGAFGISKGGSVEISNEHPTGQQAKTLAHELAHEALHKENRPDGLTRNLAGLEAEAVAYVVCTHFGLDVEVIASRYIAIWDGDSKALRESLDRIATTARALIDDVEALEARKAVA